MHHVDERQARARLAAGLMERGWTVHGFHKDESDMMTDYFAPAYWGSPDVATHPDLPGVIVGCKTWESDLKYSGEDIIEYGSFLDEDHPCELCNGSGVHPNGLTLEEAKKDPRSQHTVLWQQKQNKKNGTFIVSLMPDVVSPLHYHSNGDPKCQQCGGEGYPRIATNKVVGQQPTFTCATPKGRAWHVEKGGRVVKTGIGLNRLLGYNDCEWKPALERMLDDIERAAGRDKPTPPAGEAAAAAGDEEIEKATIGGLEVTVQHERDWTWIFFDDKPDAEVRDELKSRYNARWGKRRHGWYIKRRVSAAEIFEAVEIAMDLADEAEESLEMPVAA